MVELEMTRTQPPKLEDILEPDVDAGKFETKEMHVCIIEGCGKKFPLAALAAKHFNRTHEDFFEDKDSWREYVEKHVVQV